MLCSFSQATVHQKCPLAPNKAEDPALYCHSGGQLTQCEETFFALIFLRSEQDLLSQVKGANKETLWGFFDALHL